MGIQVISELPYRSFKFSAYTLWVNFSSDFEFIYAPVFGFGSLSLNCSFKPKSSS